LVPEYVGLINRMFGAVMFWALGSLIVAYKLLTLRLSRLTEQLRTELVERTKDLGRAVSALRAMEEPWSRAEPDLPELSDQFKRQVTDILATESRRLQVKVGHLEQGELPAPEGEDLLEKTRSELERLGKQLEQVQRDLLRP
jgi:chromosome segregation ATPase